MSFKNQKSLPLFQLLADTHMKVVLSEGAVQIFFIATSTFQSEGSCSQGDSGIVLRVTEHTLPARFLYTSEALRRNLLGY